MFGTDPAPRRRRIPTSSGVEGSGASTSAGSEAAAAAARADCPPNREQLGRHAWGFVRLIRSRRCAYSAARFVNSLAV